MNDPVINTFAFTSHVNLAIKQIINKLVCWCVLLLLWRQCPWPEGLRASKAVMKNPTKNNPSFKLTNWTGTTCSLKVLKLPNLYSVLLPDSFYSRPCCWHWILWWAHSWKPTDPPGQGFQRFLHLSAPLSQAPRSSLVQRETWHMNAHIVLINAKCWCSCLPFSEGSCL